MPLQLHNPDPSFDIRQRIVWDPANSLEVMEAQAKLDALRHQGYTVTSTDPGECVLEPPDREEHQVLVRILDDSGDTRLVWDRRNLDEVSDARAKFGEYLKQGYKAYVSRSDGTKGRRVETFDAMMEEIIMLDKKAAEAYDKEKGWRPEVIMVPKTAPG